MEQKQIQIQIQQQHKNTNHQSLYYLLLVANHLDLVENQKCSAN